MVEAHAAESKSAPKLCKNKKCCGKYVFFAKKADSEEKELLPLKRVDIKSEIRGSFAVTNVELRYVNPHVDSPLECTYVFPVEKTTILAKFEAMIDNRVVATKVMEKEKAKEKFDDAIATGQAAVMAKKDDTTMSVSLGNLLPGQEAVLK